MIFITAVTHKNQLMS